MNALRTSALLLLVLFAAACERDPLLGPPELHGEWRLVHQAEDGHTEHRLSFGSNGSFAAEYRWYGFNGQAPTVLTGRARTTGAYRLEGDRLRLRIVRIEQWHMFAAGPNPSVQKIQTPQWEEAATVEVTGDKLFYTFTSAPLDVPVVTTAVYDRLR